MVAQFSDPLICHFGFKTYSIPSVCFTEILLTFVNNILHHFLTSKCPYQRKKRIFAESVCLRNFLKWNDLRRVNSVEMGKVYMRHQYAACRMCVMVGSGRGGNKEHIFWANDLPLGKQGDTEEVESVALHSSPWEGPVIWTGLITVC